MRVLHIIPSAFDYFDSIRFEAFKILETEAQYGIDSSAVTLEYDSASRDKMSKTKESAPGQKFLGRDTVENNSKEWDDFDIINLHCPFFGGVNKILNWVNKDSRRRLVLTYHFDFFSTDLISWFMKMYNYFYLPKLAKKSKVIFFFSSRYSESKIGIKIFKKSENVVILGLGKNFKDIHSKEVVEDLFIVYNSIVKSIN